MAVVQSTMYSGTKAFGLFADVHTASVLQSIAVRELYSLISMAMPKVPLRPVNAIEWVVDVG